MKLRTLFFVFFLVSPALLLKCEPIRITMVEGQISRFNENIIDPYMDLDDLLSSHGKSVNRWMADFLILLNALKLGGQDSDYQLVPVPNESRSRELIRNGRVVVSSSTYFSSTFGDDVYLSTEILPIGAFVKGIYTHPDNHSLLSVTSVEELRTFSAVVVSSWMIDRMTLESLSLKDVFLVDRFPSLFQMIHIRDIDFTLLEVPFRQDLSKNNGGLTLVPIPGVLIALMDSRHFMVSKEHPLGYEVLRALERGVKILRDSGYIEKIMKHVGFYREDLEDWTIINQ